MVVCLFIVTGATEAVEVIAAFATDDENVMKMDHADLRIDYLG